MKKNKDYKVKLIKAKRKTWEISPVTRIKPNKKIKSRDKLKEELRKELNND